ncbi:MAG: PAS domain S-box protein, partial [Bacteroidetes bacterium]|nr:PAS domain S-box protein [Bacteroidota bacterium]
QGSQRFEWIHKKANGQEFPAEVLLTAIVNELNSPAIFCVIRDITQRKMFESALLSAKENAEHSEEFLNNIINKIIDPVFVKDDKSRLLVVNDAFCKMFDTTAEAILGKTMAEDVSEKERDLFLKVDKRVIETGEDSISEETLTLRNKPTFTILTRKSRFVDEHGKKFIIGIITDISSLKKTEIELLKAKEKAEESERLKSAFLANMSHEIRTPMNAILGFSNLLEDKKLDATKRSKFIKLINDSGNRLLHIISDIIDVSKINANQLDVQLKPCNLNEIINNLYYQFSIQIKNKALTLDTFKALDDDESHINTDGLRLFQVLSNLIENALKFTQKGLVRFGYTIESDMVQFFIEDSGIGIEEQSKDIIFERFHQGNNQSLKSGKGNGLGLAISKGIVELLGGTIWLEKTSEKGSTFMFTIPFTPVKKNDSLIVEPHPPLKIRDKSHKTILIVEDEVTNFIYLREVLKV